MGQWWTWAWTLRSTPQNSQWDSYSLQSQLALCNRGPRARSLRAVPRNLRSTFRGPIGISRGPSKQPIPGSIPFTTLTLWIKLWEGTGTILSSSTEKPTMLGSNSTGTLAPSSCWEDRKATGFPVAPSASPVCRNLLIIFCELIYYSHSLIICFSYSGPACEIIFCIVLSCCEWKDISLWTLIIECWSMCWIDHCLFCNWTLKFSKFPQTLSNYNCIFTYSTRSTRTTFTYDRWEQMCVWAKCQTIFILDKRGNVNPKWGRLQIFDF